MEKMKMRGYLIKDSTYTEFQKVCEDNCSIPSRIIRKAIKEYIEIKKNNNMKNYTENQLELVLNYLKGIHTKQLQVEKLKIYSN